MSDRIGVLCVIGSDDPFGARDWRDEREHLVVEKDGEWPFITGCDCEIGRDHYEDQDEGPP